MIDENRFREMMILIPFLLPLDKQENADALDAIMGVGFTKEMPIFMKAMADSMLHYPDSLEGWLEWIKEAADYSLNKRNSYPEMEGAPMEKVMKMIRIQLDKTLSNADKIKMQKKIQQDDLQDFPRK